MNALLGQTSFDFGAWFGAYREDEADKPQTFALHTLKDDETIARLATGVKRFQLPDAHNPIKLFQQLADEKHAHGVSAAQSLAEIYENRRQFETAADWWRKVIAMTSGDERKRAAARLRPKPSTSGMDLDCDCCRARGFGWVGSVPGPAMRRDCGRTI